jgi:hypothetical protein
MSQSMKSPTKFKALVIGKDNVLKNIYYDAAAPEDVKLEELCKKAGFKNMDNFALRCEWNRGLYKIEIYGKHIGRDAIENPFFKTVYGIRLFGNCVVIAKERNGEVNINTSNWKGIFFNGCDEEEEAEGINFVFYLEKEKEKEKEKDDERAEVETVYNKKKKEKEKEKEKEKKKAAAFYSSSSCQEDEIVIDDEENESVLPKYDSELEEEEYLPESWCDP